MIKIITLICIAVIVIAIVIIAVAGNYYINFGLVRRHRRELKEHLLGELPERRSNGDSPCSNHEDDKSEVVQWKKIVNKEDVTLKSYDGIILHGKVFFPMTESSFGKIHKWVILVHGYTGSKTEMEPFAMRYCREGYIALCIDCRGHGNSGGKFIGMGYQDGRDIMAWIDHIAASDKNANIVLHGHSMGGAAVVTACGQSSKPQLTAAIADCAFSSSWRMFKKQLKEWFNIPSFPILYAAQIIFRLRGGYSFKKASAELYAPKIKVPILYIHGDADKFVPPEMSRELYNKTEAPKDIIIVHGAAHAQSQDKDPVGYYKAVFDFINQYASFS